MLLKHQLQSELQLSGRERRECFAKPRITHISVDRTEVRMVGQVNEIEAELQIALFAQPREMIVLENAGIPLKHSGTAVNVSWEVAFGANRRCWEVASGKQAVDVRGFAVRTSEVLSWTIRDIVTRSVKIVVAAVGSQNVAVRVGYAWRNAGHYLECRRRAGRGSRRARTEICAGQCSVTAAHDA